MGVHVNTGKEGMWGREYARLRASARWDFRAFQRAASSLFPFERRYHEMKRARYWTARYACNLRVNTPRECVHLKQSQCTLSRPSVVFPTFKLCETRGWKTT